MFAGQNGGEGFLLAKDGGKVSCGEGVIQHTPIDAAEAHSSTD